MSNPRYWWDVRSCCVAYSLLKIQTLGVSWDIQSVSISSECLTFCNPENVHCSPIVWDNCKIVGQWLARCLFTIIIDNVSSKRKLSQIMCTVFITTQRFITLNALWPNKTLLNSSANKVGACDSIRTMSQLARNKSRGVVCWETRAWSNTIIW